jgi:hypothetical protein
MLFTGASVIAAINSIVGGVGVALLAAKVGHLAASAALSVGIAAAVVVASAKGKGLPLACRLEPVDRLRGLPRRGWGGDPQGCDRPRAGFLPSAQGPSRAVVVSTRDEWRWQSASVRPDAAYRR